MTSFTIYMNKWNEFEILKIFDFFCEKAALKTLIQVKISTIIYKVPKFCLAANMAFLLVE